MASSEKCRTERTPREQLEINAWHDYGLKYSGQFFVFNRDGENVSEYSVLRNYLRKFMQKGNNYAKLKKVLPNPSPGLGENDGKMFSTWNPGNSK
jgi:hypothetical protein